jgi:GTP cyclohydrolase I
MEVALREGVVEESVRRRIEDKMVRVEEHVARMMVQLDPTGQRSSTEKTPYRVARMLLTELCSGYYVDIEELFEAVFPNEGSEGMVVVHHIPLYSMCEHHWLLITGQAHVGYIPNGRVLGLSKVARVVDAYARRMQLQERITRQVADAIDKHLDPTGVMVVIEAEHHCLSIRGAQKPGTITTTSEVRGLFEDNSYQDQFFKMVSR